MVTGKNSGQPAPDPGGRQGEKVGRFPQVLCKAGRPRGTFLLLGPTEVGDSLLNNSHFLWCSDLGIEWADYISLGNNTVVFAHCKHAHKSTLGATGYQEVLGQAIKNLGNVKSTPREFAQKIKATADTDTWGNTGIPRLRTLQKTWADFEKAISGSFENPNFRQEVHLVITMLSAAGFDTEAAKPKHKGSFVQLIWLLSAFINSCRELGAEAKIICKQ